VSHTRFVLLGKGNVKTIKGSDTLLGGANYAAVLKLCAQHPSTERQIMQEFKRTKEKALKHLIKDHVQNFINNLKVAFKTGMPTGMPAYRFTSVDGKSYSVGTAWEPLSAKYQKRKKPAYRNLFWRAEVTAKDEEGGHTVKPLLQSYNEFYYGGGRSVKVNVSTDFDRGYGEGGVKFVGRGARMRISTSVSVDRLGNQMLEEILKESFFGGKVQTGKWYGGEISKTDLTKLLWVEGRRPFVSDMAVSLGKLLKYELATFSGD
jgi:hypothetical protein